MAVRTGALTRALRAIERHAEFVRWHDRAQGTGGIGDEVVFDFSVDLPPQWMADGSSPSGVRPVEPVTVRFEADYPNTQPEFRLRADFPRTFPHLQPGSADQAPRPCLVQGSEANLFRRAGIEGMLSQLSRWLHAAAHDRLNDDPDAWEPARRDHVDDHVVLRPSEVHALPGGRHTWTYRSAAYTSLHMRTEQRMHRLVLMPEAVKLTTDFWRGLHQSDASSSLYGGRSLAVILAPVPLQGGARFLATQYQPDTVHDIGSLRTALTVWHCIDAFESFLTALNTHLSRYKHNGLRRLVPVVVLVNVPRSRLLAGTTSTIETMAYVLEVNFLDGTLLAGSSRVRLAAVIEQTSSELLRRFNQQTADQATHGWAAVGCGSLGSKIAVLAAHQGRAPSVLIDPEFQDPHNYARHALTPAEANAPNLMLVLKAAAVEYEIARLQQKAAAWPMPVELAVMDAAKLAHLKKAANWVLVNTTASVRVRNFLTEVGTPLGLPRIAEGALFGAGRVGYFGVTGAEQNPDCSELFVVATHKFGDDPTIAAAALSQETQLSTIRTGMGCGSETMQVTDATITLHAGAMTTALLDLHEKGLVDVDGRIWIGQQSDDRMGIRWHQHGVRPFHRVPLESEDSAPWTMHVSADVHDRIETEVKRRPGVETGGVLWGSINEALGAIYVVDLLDAPPDSKRSALSFELGVQGLNQLKAEYTKRSHGYLRCVGTWHSHLRSSGPSGQDRDVARTIARDSDHPNALLIWTPSGYCGLLADAMDTSERAERNSRATEEPNP